MSQHNQRFHGLFPFLLFFPFFFLIFSGCGTAQVLGIPEEEAASYLRMGETRFIRLADLGKGFSGARSQLNRLFTIHPAAPFYAALHIVNDESPANEVSKNPRSNRDLEILLFCTALESPSPSARREAAVKLIPLILESRDSREVKDILGFLGSRRVKRTEEAPALNSACLYNLGRYKDLVKLFPASPAVPGISDVSGAWSKALSLFAEWKDPGSKEDSERAGREISSFLFGQIPAEVLRWAHSEALSLDGLLDPAELAALSGRLNPEDYGTSLRNFRSAISQDENVFFRYPQLIAELGRAYQYTPLFREEGASLFKSWAARASSVDAPGLYYLLFYSGRILRSLARYSESGEYFRRARALAPDALQSDTCVWYMLMNTMAENPRNTAAAVTATMPFWKDMSYFTDVLERLSAYLAAERQWNTMLEIFSAMENQGGQSLSQYAWILGRAAQEGYITTGRGAEDFFRIAFREAKGSFYYRAMAASKLGETFAPELQLSGEPDAALKAETEFILGLIEYAAPFARQYIRAAEDGLGAGELRQIAQALASAGEIRESLNIISRYTAREGYEPNYRDLELFYPRPFVDLTEKYAREAGIGPEILYGLIRTESYFEPEAVSRSGATGLAQLMPSTAEEMAGRIARLGGKDYRETLDLKDPETSVHIGSFYLGYLIRNMGSPMLALLSYNGGMGRVRRWLGQAPGGLPHDLFLETIEFGETREYGRRVLAAAAAYGYLYYGMSMEAVAEDIYRSSAP